MPCISILRETVHKEDGSFGLVGRREALSDHPKLLGRRHHDLFDELDALLTVDGLFDDFGA